MSWYAASIVVCVKFMDGEQDSYPLWENVVLIEASSENEAFRKAELIGKESDGDEFYWEDRSAVWEFSGIRKLLSIDTGEEDGSIIDGTEVTFSQMLLDSKSDLKKFIDGDEVSVIYEK